MPDFVTQMMENKWLGSKSGQGFYKKEGKIIRVLDLNTLEYRDKKRSKFATLELTKSIDNVIDRFKVLVDGKDKAVEFYRKNFAAMFAYVSNRIPEISEELFKIDDAMKAGFGWEHGPFQIWDAVGVEKGLALIKAEGLTAAQWVFDMVASGNNSFYTIENGATFAFDISTKKQLKIPGQEAFIILDNIRKSNEVFNLSEKTFNPALYPLINYWGFYKSNNSNFKPDSSEIDSLLNLCQYIDCFTLNGESLCK